MRKLFFLFITLLCISLTHAQNVGIGTTTPQAALDVSSTTQGFLPPRMSQDDRDLLTPITGLMIFNTTTNKPNYYDGLVWRNFSGTIAATSTVLAIGDSYQGGLIAYLLQPGDAGYDPYTQHGLIVTVSDVGAFIAWGCQGTTIGTTGTAIGTGSQNTLDIIAGCPIGNIAAWACDNLVLNGYSDWYLPSQDELNMIYINKASLTPFSGGIGAGACYYWSSSEGNVASAFGQDFFSGGVVDLRKDGGSSYGTSRLRAVRSF